MILGELIEANNDATLKELVHLFPEKTGVNFRRATMGRMTQKLKMTVKKTLYAAEKESEQLLKLRREFCQNISDIRVEDLIFIDEDGIN